MKPLTLLSLVLPLTLIAAGFKSQPEKVNEFNKSLLQAAAKGDIAQVKSLLSKGADVNAKDKFGWTALHFATAQGSEEVARHLIAGAADVNAKDRRGRTPLDLAQKAENKEMVDLLLVHDVAVTKVSAPPSCVQGETVSIGVTIENTGNCGESVAVKLMSLTDGVDIGNETITVGDLADLVFNSENEEKNYFGNNICIGGDANGDGYADVLIGAKGWKSSRGRAYLHFGGPNMDTQADVVFTGENTTDRFSDQSGAFGDVNHDGYDDVIIGAFGYPAGKNDGRVYVYYGGPSIDNVADMTLEGEVGQRSIFGLMVTASDINHDGHIDLLIGAQNYDHGGEQLTVEYGPIGGRGRVYLYWGGDPMDTRPDIIFEGENRGDWFGRRISARGDVNGDGYNDILVGARRWGEEDNGRAYLFFGNTKEQMNSKCDWIFTGEAPKNQMGSALTIFDIDNDGIDDVLVNARFAARSRGRVYIYWGDQEFDGSQPAVILEGDGCMTEIECGYFNDDSYGDILAGCWAYRDATGRAYLFYGQSKAKIDTDRDHVFSAKDGTRAFFGNQVRAGDVNGDGYADALIAAPEANDVRGRVYLYYSPFSSTEDITFNWDTANASPGKHILKATIIPVAGEKNTADNTVTVTVEVKGPYK